MKIKHRFTGMDYIEDIEETRIKFKDIFHIKNVYTDMHDWLVEEGYGPVGDPYFPEILYNHMWVQNAGEEIRFWWRVQKPTASNYYRYEMDITVLSFNIKPTEIMLHGKKFKANTGEMEIKVRSRILIDPDGRWKKHFLLKHLHPLLYKRLLFKKLDVHREELHHDVRRFMEMLKEHFQLKRYLPEQEAQQFYTNKQFE
jgi:hypothetical protein